MSQCTYTYYVISSYCTLPAGPYGGSPIAWGMNKALNVSHLKCSYSWTVEVCEIEITHDGLYTSAIDLGVSWVCHCLTSHR